MCKRSAPVALAHNAFDLAPVCRVDGVLMLRPHQHCRAVVGRRCEAGAAALHHRGCQDGRDVARERLRTAAHPQQHARSSLQVPPIVAFSIYRCTYHYTLFLPKETGRVCRQYKGEGCQKACPLLGSPDPSKTLNALITQGYQLALEIGLTSKRPP